MNRWRKGSSSSIGENGGKAHNPRSGVGQPVVNNEDSIRERASNAMRQNASMQEGQMDAYQKQQLAWKEAKERQESAKARAAASANSDRERIWITQLCLVKGTNTYPPREKIAKFTNLCHTLDPHLLNEQIEEKLRHRMWEVSARALSVLEAMLQGRAPSKYHHCLFFASSDPAPYGGRNSILRHQKSSKLQLVTRVEKVLGLIDALLPESRQFADQKAAQEQAQVQDRIAEEQRLENERMEAEQHVAMEQNQQQESAESVDLFPMSPSPGQTVREAAARSKGYGWSGGPPRSSTGSLLFDDPAQLAEIKASKGMVAGLGVNDGGNEYATESTGFDFLGGGGNVSIPPEARSRQESNQSNASMGDSGTGFDFMGGGGSDDGSVDGNVINQDVGGETVAVGERPQQVEETQPEAASGFDFLGGDDDAEQTAGGGAEEHAPSSSNNPEPEAQPEEQHIITDAFASLVMDTAIGAELEAAKKDSAEKRSTDPEVDEAQKEAPMFSGYKVGMQIFYTDADGSQVKGYVMKVHKEDVVPYFTVQLENGTEKQTILSRLKPAIEDAPVVSSAGMPLFKPTYTGTSSPQLAPLPDPGPVVPQMPPLQQFEHQHQHQQQQQQQQQQQPPGQGQGGGFQPQMSPQMHAQMPPAQHQYPPPQQQGGFLPVPYNQIPPQGVGAMSMHPQEQQRRQRGSSGAQLPTYKLLVEGDMFSHKQTLTIAVGSYEELHKAVAVQLKLPPGFTMLIWDTDFGEYAEFHALADIQGFKAKLRITV